MKDNQPLVVIENLPDFAPKKRPSTFAPPLPEDLLSSRQVRATLGGISEMTLWRWGRRLDFQPPDCVIGRLRFWRRATVQSWVARQPKGSAAHAPTG